jgi:hypothetical protein
LIYIKGSTVVFEFYLINLQIIEEGFEASETFKKGVPENVPMVLNLVWILALRIMQLFEETIHQLYPCKIFNLEKFK